MMYKPRAGAVDNDGVVRQYAAMVYRMAFSMVGNEADADDVFQEVFLRYVRAKTAFESEEHRKAWLLRVTINCAKKHRTSAWSRRVVALEDDVAAPEAQYHGLLETVDRLPPKYRAVIHLHYYEGYSVGQMSGILRIKQSTIRSQLTRARARLRDMLKGDEDVS